LIKERGRSVIIGLNLKKLVRGDRKTWNEFVDRFSPVIYAAVWKIFRTHLTDVNDCDVEDAVQGVFLRLIRDDFRLLKSYNPRRASPVTWLTIVTRSTAIDCLRRRKLATVSLDAQGPDISAPRRPTGTATVKIIPPGILSPRQELVLKLIFDRGMDAGEIAGLLGVSPQTIRSTRHKALVKLRKFFSSKD